MTRALLSLLLSLCCTSAWGPYPINPAFPQPPSRSAYSPYLPFYQPAMIYPGLSPYGYQPCGFWAAPFGGVNLLPPNPPSPYYVTLSGREYLEHVARREKATYSQLKLQHDLQK
jgi:hypothetical protein